MLSAAGSVLSYLVLIQSANCCPPREILVAGLTQYKQLILLDCRKSACFQVLASQYKGIEDGHGSCLGA